MRYQSFYQYALLFFALLVLFAIGFFIYYEIFPEYKNYQYAYQDLEKFRSEYTHQKPVAFATGIKQILIPNSSGGPEIVDRCTSCHVAMDLPHFSPTRPAHDVNDQQIFDSAGRPVLEANPDYIWAHLEQKINEFRSPVIIEELQRQGKKNEILERLAAAEKLTRLRWKEVDGKMVDLEKALQMHPLIGEERRPFQFHSMEQYGCTTCHSGNGQSLVAKRAHGPLYDSDYEPAHQGVKPQFTENDPQNDPPFAKMYNNKPGHDLVFQTTPLLAGPLIEAKCVQCHQSATGEVESALNKLTHFADQKKDELESIEKGAEHEKEALEALLELRVLIERKGREEAIDWLNTKLQDGHLSSGEIDALEGQIAFLKRHEESAFAIQQEIDRITQSDVIAEKERAFSESQKSLKKFLQLQEPFKMAIQDKDFIKKMGSDIDRLIASYHRGKETFISQACYACHRISGFSRASVGPELTKAGNNYPWYIKESIVWPQADLPSSTMPNYRLDHEELGDLMSFLMAQKGVTKTISDVDYQIGQMEWEKGKKMPWEKPIPPTHIENVRAGQLVFTSEGCAACHKLQGFESNVGLKDKIVDQEWFYKLFPEGISGSVLAKRVEENGDEIERRLVSNTRSNGIIEEIGRIYPGLIEGFYTNFKFAGRAYNTAFQNVPEGLQRYKKHLHQILMLYIQEYGLGRDIAPHLHWSGIFRDNEWLLGHFHNPPGYTARSIMPVMPFDDTKFYMLNYMLHHLAKQNREALHEVWHVQGFDPAGAYETLCSSCHGAQRQGNGVISEWIYPIPKNLRNPIFLRNLTKERVIDSIMHGVKGTPMPPWGEVISSEELGDQIPILSHTEIVRLVDWLYQNVPNEPGGPAKEEYAKWHYMPQDVITEMKKEKFFLKPQPKEESDHDLIDAYFEARPNPIPGPEKEFFYIGEKYYTPENLEAAKQYFITNCAICHGNEGGGTGLRSTSMVEAKPRMFTNLPWIRSRDDLRLLRSIKYGVSGTSMVPWGDQTTAVQRMQLVMFIRELTKPSLLRNDLEDILYEAYDRSEMVIEEARIKEYHELERETIELKQIEQKLDLEVDAGKASAEQLGSLYSQSIQLKKSLEKKRERDHHYLSLIQLLKEEKEIYSSLGDQTIAAKLSAEAIACYFEIVKNAHHEFSLLNGSLHLSENKERNLAQNGSAQLLQILDTIIATLQINIDVEKDKFHSAEQEATLQTLISEQKAYINLRTKLIIQLADASALRQKEQTIYKTINHFPI